MPRKTKRSSEGLTYTLTLPSDADLDKLSPPTTRPLTMFEQLCLSSTTGKPRSFEKARMDMQMFFELTEPETKNRLNYFILSKARDCRMRNRQRQEDEWDWRDDT